MAINHWCF